MAQVLDDGTVVPSFLGTRNRGVAEDTGAFSNVALRLGEVKAVVTPDSAESLTKKYNEYSVEVQHRDGSGPGTSSLYTNCLLASLFGGVADQCRYTLRVDPQEKGQEDGVGVGAKVLLICVNGESTRTWIIGGVRDPDQDQTTDKKDDGHNYFWEFNGVQQKIDKDGQFSLIFRGATKVDGTLADGVDEKNSGARLFFDKDGGAIFFDGGDGLEGLYLNKKDKKVTLFSDGTAEINAPDGIQAITDKSLDLIAKNVHIGAADTREALVLGTTYRDKETQLHDSLATEIQNAITQVTTLLTLHATSGSVLTTAGGLMVVPVAGAIAAGPQIAAVGAQLISMSSTLGQLAATLGKMYAALKLFEAQASTYLSRDHSTE